MASGKIDTENYESLKLCWSLDRAIKVASKGGKRGYTVDQLLRSSWVGFEDIMSAVCHTEVIDAEVLYAYAGAAARNQLPIIEQALPEETVFAEAVEACLNGDAIDKAEASTKVDRALTRLSKDLEGNVSSACKSVRACVHFNPGSAALGAGVNAAATHENKKIGSREQKELLRTMFLEAEVIKCHRSKT